MRRVFLVRHGEAESRSASGRDEDRELTAKGRRELGEIGKALLALGADPEEVWTSPLVRARETAEILGESLGRHPVVEPALAPAGDLASIASRLNTNRGATSILLVGHLPDIGELTSLLLTGDIAQVQLDFGKASIACLVGGAAPPLGRLTLQWFLRAPQLSALGRRA